MSNPSKHPADLPLWRQHNRGDRVRPTNPFTEYKKEEIEQSIPERFEQMVRLYPDRIAVKTRTHTLTYDELNKAANRVAHAILAKRGQREEPTALLLEKDAPIIAAILGVLKTGKICVPVDPYLPQARITSMLDDSQAGLIVTNSQNVFWSSELAGNRSYVVNIDTINSSFSDENLGLFISPDTPAYIIYTSGSTGEPKGIIINHRNLLHNVMRNTKALHVSQHDRWTLLRSCGTAGAVNDIFSVLLNGGTVYPFDIRDEGLSHLAAWLIREEITIYSSVATVFRHFVSTLTKEQFPNLRLVYLGGEPVYKSDVEQYKKRFAPDCLFVNRLGTSESGTVRYYFVDKKTLITGSVVPIGYPAEDMEIILLDDVGREIGFTQVGEIAVKSRYLSPGYWRRPNLTKAAFLTEPEGGDKRIYLTGDLGCMLPDGCLEHLGRKDFQVQIRGNRIEAAEIESVLLSLDTVKEAIVVAQQEGISGDKRLVAYVVPAEEPTPTASELRRFLSEKLPDYMIPSVFVKLDALPLTPNGKVDRKALPVPDSSRPELGAPFVVPRTPVEVELAKIWAEVLSLDQVGIQDNFFDLGGHSLAATRVISRAINTFKVELSIKSLFESPTVADMAVVITQNQAKKARPEDLACMLTEVESLSNEEAQRLLVEESK